MGERHPMLRESHRAMRRRRPGQVDGRGCKVHGKHFGCEGFGEAEVSVGVIELVSEAAPAVPDNMIVGQRQLPSREVDVATAADRGWTILVAPDEGRDERHRDQSHLLGDVQKRFAHFVGGLCFMLGMSMSG